MISIDVSNQTVTVSAGNQTSSAATSGVRRFIDLSDCPSSYASHAGEVVAVNSTETGLEFIPISAGSSGFRLSATQPTDTTTSWVDTGNSYAGMYPIRRYINGAWEAVTNDGDYYDPIGGVISKGKPLCVLVWGQSNTASSFYLDYLDQTTGDVAKDQRIALWNYDGAAWSIPDFANQPAGLTTQNWSWNLNLGANNIQTFAKLFVRNSGRSIRIVQWRQGGTGLAYWEPGGTGGGGPGWLALIAAATASGVSYFDLVIGIHGEGGLTDGSHTSLYSNYKDSLYFGMMATIRQQSFCDSKTAFIMPSQAAGMFLFPVGISDQSEYAIRTLGEGTNPYNAWAQGPHIRAIQKPLANTGSTTSSTSVNLSTVTAPVSITVATGLGSPYSSTNPIVVYSRSTGEYFIGSVSAYISATGAMTIAVNTQTGVLTVVGTGTHTDWDVLPQDYLHHTVHDNILNGQAIYLAYRNIINGFVKNPVKIQDRNLSYELITAKESFPVVDDYETFHLRRTTNGNIKINSYISSIGGRLPNTREYYEMGPSSSAPDRVFTSSSAHEATKSDEVLRETALGLIMNTPIFWFYNAFAGFHTKIIKEGVNGLGYYIGSNGDGNHKFYNGTTQIFEINGKTGFSKSFNPLIVDNTINPTQITGNTNDYAPTGIVTAATIRMSASAPFDLTGVATGVNNVNGRELTIVNIGASTITIRSESASSSASNRFSLNADFALAQNMAAMFVYDGTSARWRKLY